jgi:hypothetical protein
MSLRPHRLAIEKPDPVRALAAGGPLTGKFVEGVAEPCRDISGAAAAIA